MDIALTIFLSCVLIAACVTDLREQRIPNLLTYPAMAVALLAQAFLPGGQGAIFALAGLGVGGGLMLVPFLFGVMGAGDVKLMAAAGAVLGPSAALSAFVLTTLLGGLYALFVLCLHRRVFAARLRAYKDAAVVAAATGSLNMPAPDPTHRLPRLCYGLAIAAGCFAHMLLAANGKSLI